VVDLLAKWMPLKATAATTKTMVEEINKQKHAAPIQWPPKSLLFRSMVTSNCYFAGYFFFFVDVHNFTL